MIGEKIRKIRTLKGYSQEYVSEKLNISQSAYSDIETNKSKLDIDRIKQIADILQVDFNELISFNESQIFNNEFNENSNGFFNNERVILDSFEHERQSYKDMIAHLKEEIEFLRKKL